MFRRRGVELSIYGITDTYLYNCISGLQDQEKETAVEIIIGNIERNKRDWPLSDQEIYILRKKYSNKNLEIPKMMVCITV